ncbi:MAG: glycosyl transferase family 2 [Bacteroidetes bacterium MedPE-SWsnd-G2]|nr:MAG: glycosyl transferase family 2 [Bacteroidetes bacterium MedPE-SWsnd-G2]
MQLSVVILNYNVEHFLELCLKSVTNALKQIDAEIIVVDNKSSDGSCQMVEDKFPEVHLIANTQNFGFSKGNNIAVAQAKGAYVCILNPDTVVEENTFKSVLKFMADKPNVGIVGCKLIDGLGRFLPESKRNVPKPKIAIKKLLGNTKGYYVNSLQANEIGYTDVLVGAFMMVKKEVYDEVGGFDEDYFMYGEDIDLSYRVIKNGYQNYYFGETAIVHFKGESTLKDKQYAQRFFGAMHIFYKKHFKNNKVLDSLIWLGTKIGAVMVKGESGDEVLPNKTVVISDKSFNFKFSGPVTYSKSLSELVLESNTEVVFDMDYLSYKEAILFMNDVDKKLNLTFKFIPEEAPFLIGSNSSKSRGQVLFKLNN